jgi:hypothetical protein
MIYRGPGSSPSYDLAPSPTSLSSQVVALCQSSCVSPVELTDGRGGGGVAKSYFVEKAWSSVNHSIFSYIYYIGVHLTREKHY